MTTNDVSADTGDVEALGRRIRSYAASEGMCWCDYDSENTLGNEVVDHIVHSLIEDDWLAARDAAQRADEREQWAAWLEGWLGAVGPERPTVEAVIAWLRADWRPFGVHTGTAGGSDA